MEVIQQHMTTLQFIESREGTFKAQHHESEKTLIELWNYFDANYAVFSDDTPTELIIEDALEKMGERDFMDMVKRNQFSDIYEMLVIEGFVTSIGSIRLVSTKFPLQGFSEQ